MPAYKDKAKGTWYASFYFENWTGKKEKKMKRGFKTKREALEWERTFQVMAWQSEMLNYRDKNGKPYSPVYLKTLHNQELICKGWFLPSNTYDCGSFVVN